MLDFRSLLELAGFGPGECLIVRHSPIEKKLKRVLPWLVAERPELFLAYQRIQWAGLEKAMTRARHIASFVSQDTGTATYAGFYRIGNWHELDYEGYCNFPGNRELEALGMSGRSPDTGDCLAFQLEPVELHSGYIGRLVIDWPKPFQSWWRWATRGGFMISSIEPESRFVRGMPRWDELVLNWPELNALPASWRARLAEWRGVYLIHDTRRCASYVGSASGQDNILGRWLGYARTGHGGNVALRASAPEDLRFSILQRTSPDLEPAEVVALEQKWKLRLHTRESGLNRN